MKYRNVICIDLAKNTFQILEFRGNEQIGKNRSVSRQQFIKLIETHRQSHLVMESCTGAQHWARLARSHGHDVTLIPPKVVAKYRQNQKTDANDALAIYDAFHSRQLKPSPEKTRQHQELAVLEGARNRYQKKKTSLNNAMRGHLAEFGIVFAKGYSALNKHIPLILGDAENGLPDGVRMVINVMMQEWLAAHQQVLALQKHIAKALTLIDSTREVEKIQGIGKVGVSLLLVAIGDGKAFNKAKEVSAFVGTSPKQFSTGGKEVIIGIPKYSGHTRLRSVLIQGAWSVIMKLRHREPANALETWLLELIKRAGEKRAAVALANKNVRMAWAIMSRQETFKAPSCHSVG